MPLLRTLKIFTETNRYTFIHIYFCCRIFMCIHLVVQNMSILWRECTFTSFVYWSSAAKKDYSNRRVISGWIHLCVYLNAVTLKFSNDPMLCQPVEVVQVINFMTLSQSLSLPDLKQLVLKRLVDQQKTHRQQFCIRTHAKQNEQVKIRKTVAKSCNIKMLILCFKVTW